MGRRNFNVEGPIVPAPGRCVRILDKPGSIHRAARDRATRPDAPNVKDLAIVAFGFARLIEKMLHADPKSRPTAKLLIGYCGVLKVQKIRAIQTS